MTGCGGVECRNQEWRSEAACFWWRWRPKRELVYPQSRILVSASLPRLRRHRSLFSLLARSRLIRWATARDRIRAKAKVHHSSFFYWLLTWGGEDDENQRGGCSLLELLCSVARGDEGGVELSEG